MRNCDIKSSEIERVNTAYRVECLIVNFAGALWSFSKSTFHSQRFSRMRCCNTSKAVRLLLQGFVRLCERVSVEHLAESAMYRCLYGFLCYSGIQYNLGNSRSSSIREIPNENNFKMFISYYRLLLSVSYKRT